ncbi:MAG: beta-galactosidase [Clostridia bacterium]|nr:beta-galactosidase [Clostridia bacterium]
MGEMKKDFRLMKEMGFQHIRIAAIGTTKLDENGRIVIDTPFVDAMIEEAERLDISISVRLHGFSVNLRDFKNVLMVDNEGNPQDTTVWLNFIQATMCHEGLLEDNFVYSKALSEKYAKKSNVVGYQIYNEPHYPSSAVYDYHETTVSAYRKWLVEQGVMTEADAKDYQPPKSRAEESPEMWALWRRFSQHCLDNFLNHAEHGSKEGSSIPTFTCYTPCQLYPSSPFEGADIFANARSSMDIVGYTCYYHAVGAEYYAMNQFLDLNASAAAANGKEAWCIELDSRTYIPLEIFNKNTFATLGSGVKGLIYYQWRGDHPSPATPIPNGCGLVNYDGSKTKNYDNAASMVKFINDMSDYLVNARRPKEHIAVFHSDYATFLCDATENTDEKSGDPMLSNSYQLVYKEIYRELRKQNYAVDIVDTDALDKNTLEIKTLFVPSRKMLSNQEQEVIEKFIQKGGQVFESCASITDVNVTGSYMPYGTEIKVYTTYYTMEEVCNEFLNPPLVKADNPLVGVQRLEGDGYQLIVLTNLSCTNKTQTLRLNFTQAFTEAILCTPNKRESLAVNGEEILVSDLTDGAIILVK